MKRTFVLIGCTALVVLALGVIGVSTAMARTDVVTCEADGKVAGEPARDYRLICPSPEPPKTASIVLTVFEAPTAAWASVQYLDKDGVTWVAVPGWTGLLNQGENGFMLFAVDKADLGKGSFRWVIYDKDPAQGGKVWAMTDKFNLPQLHDWEKFYLQQGYGLTSATK